MTRLVPLGFICLVLLPLDAFAVSIATVPVGKSDANFPEFARVPRDFRIGTYEVTNAQYAEFLNATAGSDSRGLYNESMGTDPRGGISRTGNAGSYSFVVREKMANKPVNFVSFLDAARFANWLHNGQGAGDTETGAYTLLGGTAMPTNADSITRNTGAKWFLPSSAEWTNAAYYEAGISDHPSTDLWTYPTRYNPRYATANADGDINNAALVGGIVANLDRRADWNGQDGNVTSVGSAGLLSASPSGTYDQAGNVWEVVDSIPTGNGGALLRSYLGGGWDWPGGTVMGNHVDVPLDTETASYGFRVATVPEPSTWLLGAMALLALLRYRRSAA